MTYGEQEMNTRLKINLYINPSLRKHQYLYNNLRQALKRKEGADIELKVVDAVTEIDSALKDNVFMIPTIVRISPLPERRLVGNITDPRRIMKALSV